MARVLLVKSDRGSPASPGILVYCRGFRIRDSYLMIRRGDKFVGHSNPYRPMRSIRPVSQFNQTHRRNLQKQEEFRLLLVFPVTSHLDACYKIWIITKHGVNLPSPSGKTRFLCGGDLMWLSVAHASGASRLPRPRRDTSAGGKSPPKERNLQTGKHPTRKRRCGRYRQRLPIADFGLA